MNNEVLRSGFCGFDTHDKLAQAVKVMYQFCYQYLATLSFEGKGWAELTRHDAFAKLLLKKTVTTEEVPKKKQAAVAGGGGGRPRTRSGGGAPHVQQWSGGCECTGRSINTHANAQHANPLSPPPPSVARVVVFAPVLAPKIIIHSPALCLHAGQLRVLHVA